MKVKQLLATIALATVGFGAQSATQAEIDEYCTVLGSVAKVIMEMRQSGAPIGEVLSKNKSGLTREITIRAFKIPRYDYEVNQKKEVLDFSNDIMVSCLVASTAE